MTKSQALEMLAGIANAVLETVRETPEGVPLGPMYAAFMARGMSLETFEAIVNGLVNAGKIRRSNYCLFAI